MQSRVVDWAEHRKKFPGGLITKHAWFDGSQQQRQQQEANLKAAYIWLEADWF